jgi:hypothetical protein
MPKQLFRAAEKRKLDNQFIATQRGALNKYSPMIFGAAKKHFCEALKRSC